MNAPQIAAHIPAQATPRKRAQRPTKPNTKQISRSHAPRLLPCHFVALRLKPFKRVLRAFWFWLCSYTPKALNAVVRRFRGQLREISAATMQGGKAKRETVERGGLSGRF